MKQFGVVVEPPKPPKVYNKDEIFTTEVIIWMGDNCNGDLAQLVAAKATPDQFATFYNENCTGFDIPPTGNPYLQFTGECDEQCWHEDCDQGALCYVEKCRNPCEGTALTFCSQDYLQHFDLEW